MRKMWLLLGLGLLAGCAQGPTPNVVAPAAADGACMVSEQPGCLQVTTIVVRYDPTHHEVASLVNGTLEGMKATSIAPDSRPGKQLRRDPTCRRMEARIWNMNRGPIERIGVYDARNRDQMDRRPAVDISKTASVVVIGENQRSDVVIGYETCGGKGGIQIPWSMVTDQTAILLCPVFDALYPRVDNPVRGERAGTWLYADRIQEMRRKGWVWTTTPVVVN